MNREEYLKYLIQKQGVTRKEFARTIDMPYSTLLSILNNSVGGASVDNVIKICRGLSISLSDLQRYAALSCEKIPVEITAFEHKLLRHYRRRPEMQRAVNLLLGLEHP